MSGRAVVIGVALGSSVLASAAVFGVLARPVVPSAITVIAKKELASTVTPVSGRADTMALLLHALATPRCQHNEQGFAQCMPNHADDHPYLAYTTVRLQALAWADAHAAVVLASRWRLRSPAVARDLVVQAAAVTGDARPLRWLANYPTLLTRGSGQLGAAAIDSRRLLLALASAVERGAHTVPVKDVISQLGEDARLKREFYRQLSRIAALGPPTAR